MCALKGPDDSSRGGSRVSNRTSDGRPERELRTHFRNNNTRLVFVSFSASMAKCVFDAHVHFTNRSVVSYDWMGETPGLSATHEYTEAELVAHAAASVTLAVPAALGGNAVASLRYILHDTPCINQTCAVRGVYVRANTAPGPAPMTKHTLQNGHSKKGRANSEKTA